MHLPREKKNNLFFVYFYFWSLGRVLHNFYYFHTEFSVAHVTWPGKQGAEHQLSELKLKLKLGQLSRVVSRQSGSICAMNEEKMTAWLSIFFSAWNTTSGSKNSNQKDAICGENKFLCHQMETKTKQMFPLFSKCT